MKWLSASGTSGRWSRFRLALFVAFLSAPVAAWADPIFDGVVREAQQLAAAPFQPNESALPLVWRNLNYDTYRDITFRPERSLWRGAREPFQAQFFPPGYLFAHPVALNQVVDGKVCPIPFLPLYFHYPKTMGAGPATAPAPGFAGFRLLYPLNHAGRLDEVISFLGTDYFRALGRGQSYGISARGVAVNTGENLREEFPDFREFWLCEPAPGAREMQFFALLDGPSVAGAYRFVVRPGAETRVEVEAHLFFRRDVQAFGIAPLTSMFWRGEKEARPPNDPRPEVHDSDGLLLGPEEWHPLQAVGEITTTVFPEEKARPFALLQRDRDPAHYRDAEAKYDRRPSVRVEPLGEWGPGSVRLLQLPTPNEYNDNVVLFWQPRKLPQAGDALVYKYRLHWFSRESNKPKSVASEKAR